MARDRRPLAAGRRRADGHQREVGRLRRVPQRRDEFRVDPFRPGIEDRDVGTVGRDRLEDAGGATARIALV
ncbi:hypothetical protein [Saliphagus infecundisoli]|uniref:hypothetical protein n=1 Tax=Saliphagus infecundisoli TaxID=1849069 RepID=UPI001CD6EC69|nr:hypothetical protein [Saliphagus infecundisoli]